MARRKIKQDDKKKNGKEGESCAEMFLA